MEQLIGVVTSPGSTRCHLLIGEDLRALYFDLTPEGRAWLEGISRELQRWQRRAASLAHDR
ncbi:MAG: hypothetical protein ACE5JQ_11980 [Candidatus Methylomirabilales bacterium]